MLLEDAESVMEFLVGTHHYAVEDVIIMGRSIGSGPACHIASLYRDVSALILMSPFTSLKDAVKTLLGKIPSLLVRDRFINR